MLAGGMTMAALLVVALPTAGASAAKLLVLSESGKPAAAESPAATGVIVAGCLVFSSGTLTVNNAAKDKVVASGEPSFVECGEGVSSSGGITEAQVGASGKATLKGKINVTKPGPCTYTYSKWKGVFGVPGSTIIEASTVGKLNKKASLKTGCAATDTEEFTGGALTAGFEPFEDALKS